MNASAVDPFTRLPAPVDPFDDPDNTTHDPYADAWTRKTGPRVPRIAAHYPRQTGRRPAWTPLTNRADSGNYPR